MEVTPNLLERLKDAIGTLKALTEFESSTVVEDHRRFFSYMYPADLATCLQIVNSLAPFSDIYSIIIIWTTSNGTITIQATEEEKIVRDVSCNIDEAEVADESIEKNEIILPESGKVLTDVDFTHLYDLTTEKDEQSDITVQVTLEKENTIQALGWHPDVISGILYIRTDKLIELIEKQDCATLQQLLAPCHEKMIVLLLADQAGCAAGSNLFIYGWDQWVSIDETEIRGNLTGIEIVQSAIQFRENECQWEVGAVCLTPFHLHIATNDLQPDGITKIFASYRDQLCIGYMANRLRTQEDGPVCDFFGHKHVQVKLCSKERFPTSTGLFRLFSWAYDNASSDKIGILRQIISLQLTEKPDVNYKLLVNSADSILRSAKSNFQFFLRRSVEQYFDKRLKVSEFLHKFSDELGKSISVMASELINNLYKTVGIVLGVIIAVLLDPPKTPVIVHWTSLLYFIYIVFILVLLLPSYYLRFRGNVLEYEHNKMELKDVLLVEEIERIEGKTFKRSRWEFLIAFFLVNLAYAVFAGIAFTIFLLS